MTVGLFCVGCQVAIGDKLLMNKQAHFLARSQRAKIKASIHYYFSEK